MSYTISLTYEIEKEYYDIEALKRQKLSMYDYTVLKSKHALLSLVFLPFFCAR